MHLLFPFHSANHTFIIEDEQSLNMLLHKSYDILMAQCLKCRLVANSKCALKQGSMFCGIKQKKACNILYGTQVMKVTTLREVFIVLFEGDLGLGQSYYGQDI